MPEAYRYGTEPYEHQRAVFEVTRDEEAHGIFLEQGLGKSKIVIDTAAWLWSKNRIDALVVIAPSGPHRSWVSGDESAGDHPYGHLGTHLPEHVPFVAAYWASSARKREREALDRVSGQLDTMMLRVLTVNVEAIGQSKRAYDFVLWFVKTFRCLVDVDESTSIKSKNKRTTRVLEISKHARYRRLTSGEPAPEGPFDLYYQLKFLEDAPLGFTSYYSFRNRYADLRERQVPHPNPKKRANGDKVKFKEVVRYKNEDELHDKLDRLSTSLRKEDCLDLPDRTYVNRYVEPTDEQRRLYNEILEDGIYRLDDSGDALDGVELRHALTRILRAQQVLGGFLPDEGGNVTAVPGRNPKLEALVDEFRQLPRGHKLVVWAVFKAEQDAIAGAFRRELGDDAVVEYHGRVDQAGRETAKARFQNDPDVRAFVGSPKAGRYDLTLTAARDVAWFSWETALEPYLQANDRVHRIGTTDNVRYAHLVVPGTVEAKSLGELVSKRSLAQSLRTFSDVRGLLEASKL